MAAVPLQPPSPDPTRTPTQQADQAAGVEGTVVCYLRTANAGSAGQRLLDRQRAKLDCQAAAHGWRVAAWIEDLHQSGATLTRPGLHRALALARRPPRRRAAGHRHHCPWPSTARSPTSSGSWPTSRAGSS